MYDNIEYKMEITEDEKALVMTANKVKLKVIVIVLLLLHTVLLTNN
jgi:hypothetical protein